MLFTIYNPTTGTIVRTGACNDNESNQTQTGEAMLEGVRGDPETQKVEVVGGVPTLVEK
jgi:hypothetical protein